MTHQLGIQASWAEVFYHMNELNDDAYIDMADSINRQIEEFINRYVVTKEDDNGDVPLTGDLTAPNVILTGDLTAEDATLSGNISAVDATLSGNISAVDATFSGDLTAGSLDVTGNGYTDFNGTGTQLGSITFSSNNGAYRKIGKWVDVIQQLTIGASGAGTGGNVFRLSVPTGTMGSTYDSSGVVSLKQAGSGANIIGHVVYYSGSEVCFEMDGDTGRYDTLIQNSSVLKLNYSYITQ